MMRVPSALLTQGFAARNIAKPMPKQQLIGIVHQRTKPVIAASSRQASAGATRRRA
jgi:hypothetical protein